MEISERLDRKIHDRVDTYVFKVNSHNRVYEPELNNITDIAIVFKNGKFDYAKFPFKSPYTEAIWEVMAAINLQIKFITEMLELEKKAKLEYFEKLNKQNKTIIRKAKK